MLLQYAGIVLASGGTDQEKEEYLEIACRASMDEQVPADERSRVSWGSLASYVPKKGTNIKHGDSSKCVLKCEEALNMCK